jgi:hypothetical protein
MLHYLKSMLFRFEEQAGKYCDMLGGGFSSLWPRMLSGYSLAGSQAVITFAKLGGDSCRCGERNVKHRLHDPIWRCHVLGARNHEEASRKGHNASFPTTVRLNPASTAQIDSETLSLIEDNRSKLTLTI